MSNLSMVERVCRGGKSCKKCGIDILVGAKYWSGPYKSLCLKCYAEEAAERAAPQPVQELPDSSYVVSGRCDYCPRDAIGILWSKKVCVDCINKALTDNI